MLGVDNIEKVVIGKVHYFYYYLFVLLWYLGAPRPSQGPRPHYARLCTHTEQRDGLAGHSAPEILAVMGNQAFSAHP